MEATEPNCVPSELSSWQPAEDDITRSQGKSRQRMIYHHQEWTEFETGKLEELSAYIKENSVDVPESFCREDRLRFMQGCGFNVKKSIAAISDHLEWRKRVLPVSLNDVRREMATGFLYWHGRDKSFRPCLVVKVKGIDVSWMQVVNVCNLTVFQLEYGLKHIMVPGKVENWNIILDLAGVSLSNIPYKAMKELVSTLQSNYRARLHTMFIVNAPTLVYGVWRVVKGFLDPETVKKIQIHKSGFQDAVLSLFNREQVEKKYGGVLPENTTFHPPTMPNAPFFPSSSKVPPSSPSPLSPSSSLSPVAADSEAEPDFSPSSTINGSPSNQVIPEFPSPDPSLAGASSTHAEDVTVTVTEDVSAAPNHVITTTTTCVHTIDSTFTETESVTVEESVTVTVTEMVSESTTQVQHTYSHKAEVEVNHADITLELNTDRQPQDPFCCPLLPLPSECSEVLRKVCGSPYLYDLRADLLSVPAFLQFAASMSDLTADMCYSNNLNPSAEKSNHASNLKMDSPAMSTVSTVPSPTQSMGPSDPALSTHPLVVS
eukprot:GILJ01004669.1.p1 GENE.GILJ01004669.1~~GILJ01004669.1.p1  ORF type:complete len:544 (+),score=93.40 GILJ01004669.1:62-1693(+)